MADAPTSSHQPLFRNRPAVTVAEGHALIGRAPGLFFIDRLALRGTKLDALDVFHFRAGAGTRPPAEVHTCLHVFRTVVVEWCGRHRFCQHRD